MIEALPPNIQDAAQVPNCLGKNGEAICVVGADGKMVFMDPLKPDKIENFCSETSQLVRIADCVKYVEEAGSAGVTFNTTENSGNVYVDFAGVLVNARRVAENYDKYSLREKGEVEEENEAKPLVILTQKNGQEGESDAGKIVDWDKLGKVVLGVTGTLGGILAFLGLYKPGKKEVGREKIGQSENKQSRRGVCYVDGDKENVWQEVAGIVREESRNHETRRLMVNILSNDGNISDLESKLPGNSARIKRTARPNGQVDEFIEQTAGDIYQNTTGRGNPSMLVAENLEGLLSRQSGLGTASDRQLDHVSNACLQDLLKGKNDNGIRVVVVKKRKDR